MTGRESEHAAGPHPEQARLAEPMRSRWSPTVFDATHEVTPEQVELLLDAARWAPSCGNDQPAHLVVCPRGSHAHDVLVRHLSRGNAGWVPRASLVLVAGSQVAPDPDGPDEKGAQGGHKPRHADYDTGQAVAHLVLQAQAMGLVTHQFAGFDHEAFAAEAGVPPFVRLLAGVAVGVRGDVTDPAEPTGADDAEREQRPRRRRPADRQAHGVGWARSWRSGWEPGGGDA